MGGDKGWSLVWMGGAIQAMRWEEKGADHSLAPAEVKTPWRLL